MPEVELIGAEKGRKKRNHTKIFIIVAFILLLLFIFMTSFPGVLPINGSTITGFVTNQNSANSEELENGINFKSSLNVPEMNLDGNYEDVELRGSSNYMLKVGNQNFDLSDKSDNYIVLKNFDGEISFDSRKIILLEGKSTEVMINGVSAVPSGETSKVTIEGPFMYKELNVDDGVFLKKLSYVATGTIELTNEKETFNLNKENLTITEFYGSLNSENSKLNLQGDVQSLTISGSYDINIKAQ